MKNGIKKLRRAITRSGILTDSQLDVIFKHHNADVRTAHDYGHRLVETGCLTSFQLRELENGRGEDLVQGKYTLLCPIGRGGMGVVYKVRNRELGRVEAMKLLALHHVYRSGLIGMVEFKSSFV